MPAPFRSVMGPLLLGVLLSFVPAAAPAREATPDYMGDWQGELRIGDGEPSPALTLSVTPDQGGGWIVRAETTEFTFARELVDGSHVPGTGHAHLYVGGAKIGRMYEPEARLGRLPPGEHVIRVALNSNDHRTYLVDDAPVSATVMA